MSLDPYDPIVVVFTDRAQGMFCRGCLVAFWPKQLLPTEAFVVVGKQFMKEHRFCVPHHPAIEQPLPALATVPQLAREPGCEG